MQFKFPKNCMKTTKSKKPLHKSNLLWIQINSVIKTVKERTDINAMNFKINDYRKKSSRSPNFLLYGYCQLSFWISNWVVHDHGRSGSFYFCLVSTLPRSYKKNLLQCKSILWFLWNVLVWIYRQFSWIRW